VIEAAAPRSRPGRGRLALVLAAAIVIGVGAGVGLHYVSGRDSEHGARSSARSSDGLRGQATWAAGAVRAPQISLHDQNGRLFSLSSLRGRTVAITFFDSHCNQACPLEGRALATAERALPAAQRPVLVVVSVNPRDTSASERAAARKWGLAGPGLTWRWLAGGDAQLARVWKAYRIFVKPTKGDIVHTEALYLIDRQGFERSGYLYPFVPGFVGHDLRVLAAQGRHV
jgi:cytochrome oxidase Cu insertion factor (SCO1/SenC/PrrC family)